MHMEHKSIQRIQKTFIFLFLFFSGLFTLSNKLFAWAAEGASCTVDDNVWPTITLTWNGTDPYFSYGPGGISPYTLHNTCPAACCWDVIFYNDKTTVDGKEDFDWAALSEGGHYVQISMKASNGSGDPNYYREASYSTGGSFSIDRTAPTVTFTKPEDNVVVATTDVVLAGNISDSASMLGGVWFRFSVLEGPCMFKEDFSSAPVNLQQIEDEHCIHRESSPASCTMPIQSNFGINYDLFKKIDFSAGKDCKFGVLLNTSDRVGNGTSSELSFTVDQAPPVISISSWPVVLSSGPATRIAGVATDASEIKQIKFQLRQLDWNKKKTYWDGTSWSDSTSTVVYLEIPVSTNSIKWSYSGLPAKDLISGSHYKLTVYSVDKFNHEGMATTEFDYNACSPVVNSAVANTGEDIFEVGTAVFRELATIPHSFGHVGVYVVSDSGYLEKNGGTTRAFLNNLEESPGLLPETTSNSQHFIVQAMENGVEYTSLSGLKSKGEYWGAYEYDKLSSSDRDVIARSAALQLGKPYAHQTAGVIPWGNDWAGETPEQHFRCDGLVVYSYRRAGLIDPVAGQTNLSKPLTLAHSFNHRVTSSIPEVSYLGINSDGENVNISATAGDPESGIDRVEYFLRNYKYPEELDFLGSDEKDSSGSSNYSLQSTCNPGANLAVKAVDRAGNWELVTSTRGVIVESNKPKTNYPLPDSQLSPPINNTPLKPLDIHYLQSKAAWHFQDDLTQVADLQAYYAVDLPFESWTPDVVAEVAGGESEATFTAQPGMHTFYLAIMDSDANITLKSENFYTPDLPKLFASAKTIPAGSDTAIMFENETVPGSEGSQKLDITWATPQGYSNSPATVAYDIHTTAQFNGGLGILARFDGQGLDDFEKKRLHLVHLNNGIWEDVTAAVDTANNLLVGYTTSLSPFAIYTSSESVPDTYFPYKFTLNTTITINGGKHITPGGEQYISSTAFISLGGNDNRPGRVVAYYKSDIKPELFAAGLNSQTINKFASFSGGFLSPEGRHILGYGSVDADGNYELLKEATFYVDGTPPLVSISTGAVEFLTTSSGPVYITEIDSVTLVALDPESHSVASGVKNILRLVDIAPEQCSQEETAPEDCLNLEYTSPFTLSVGTHTLYYSAKDNVGNQAQIKSMDFVVTPTNSDLDIIPPVTHLLVAGLELADGVTSYILTTDTIAVTATDDSGIAGISYSLDVLLSSVTAISYTAPLTLGPGDHVLYYMAKDVYDNKAAVKTAHLIVSAPVESLAIVPSSGPIGVPFVIAGADFGAYSAGTTVVLIGGVSATLTLWSTDTIKGTIPGTLSAGEQTVAVMRGTTTVANVSPFVVTTPALYTLTPSSGAIGLPFTITGESFGNYVANYTQVLLGGAAMPLTLWTDNKIQGTIPGNLAAGEYPVVVERALNGGVVRSSSATFTLSDMQAFWLAPSSGPIGMPFTITGEGFGNYSAALEHVLLGDTTAPLTLWSDTKIQGTVPGSLTSGQYPVVVERRTSDGGLMQTSPMTFEVVTVDVASMTPVAGPIGLPFTIYGTNFGNYVANLTRVLIGGTTAPLTLWSANQIQGTIPGSLAAGEYPVVVERELNGGVVSSTAIAFVVTTPAAFNITPSSGAIGVPFTINGANFGNYSAAYMGVLINGATVPLTLWSDTKIQGTIPGNLVAGQYPVKVARGTADGGLVKTSALTFEVLGVNVASMTPVAGPIGMPFTIYGGNFGNYSAGLTKVLIGGTTSPVSLWTDTKIQGTVPGSLAAGDYDLVVERSLNGGVVRSLASTFTVTVPVLSTIEPSTAAVIAPFTITGTSFGNYVANYTKVLINGATMPLTLWTDTKIQGKLPFLLNGTYPVQVLRNLNGGLAESGTAYITVAEPVISSMTPMSGAVGTVFNLYGSSFGPYDASQTRVTIGGVACALSLWTDTNIRGTVPSAISYGTYTVVAMRGQALSNELEYTVPEPFRVSMARPVSMLDGEFKLGEVYVYPNPAKGGKVPVFHVEVGLADTVRIKVFTVSGQAVLERTLTGVPQAIDGKYAYEYAWEGHIASGVYYYTMEAEWAGKKLKAKGRFAVVR